MEIIPKDLETAGLVILDEVKRKDGGMEDIYEISLIESLI